MAVSGINNYKDTMYQWQAQQLKSTGQTSSSSNAASALFGNSTSMVSQVSSMIELTKYAMDAMGVGSDSRVTFSQITKYQQQLQNEFNTAVKQGLENSGISNINGLSFTLDKNGVMTVNGANASDRKKAQAWLDANPSFARDITQALSDMELDSSISFKISSIGTMSLINDKTESVQQMLNDDASITEEIRSAFTDMGVNLSVPVSISFNAEGELVASGDEANVINQWLQTNSALNTKIKKIIEKNGVEESAVSFRIGSAGNMQATVNNAGLNDVQKALDGLKDTGKKIYMGLDSLKIDANINFSLQVNQDGTVSVLGNHPDLTKVQKFFDENPDLIKKYRQIETLAGIDDARKAMQIAPSEMRKRIQIESMASWWASSDNASSFFGNYSNQSLTLMNGLNMKV